MDLSKGTCRGDQSLQVVNRDVKPLTLIERLKGKSEDIDNLEEIVNIENDLERYQKDTLKRIKATANISNGMV